MDLSTRNSYSSSGRSDNGCLFLKSAAAVVRLEVEQQHQEIKGVQNLGHSRN